MKKLLSALALSMLALTACKSNSSESPDLTPYQDDRGDVATRQTQDMMDVAVKFEEKIKVKEVIMSPLDPDAEAEQYLDEGSLAEYVISGSGVIVSNNKADNTSVILTAWHVCDRYPVGYKVDGWFSTLEVVDDEQIIVTNNMKRVKILEVLYRDKDTDVCAVRAGRAFEHAAKLAPRMPPRGAPVTVVGAPLGEWGKYLVSTSDGKYFGTTSFDIMLGIDSRDPTRMNDFAYYGFAGVGGFSGSGVFYKGKLIGLMTAGSWDYEHASYGPSLEDVKWAVEQSR